MFIRTKKDMDEKFVDINCKSKDRGETFYMNLYR